MKKLKAWELEEGKEYKAITGLWGDRTFELHSGGIGIYDVHGEYYDELANEVSLGDIFKMEFEEVQKPMTIQEVLEAGCNNAILTNDMVLIIMSELVQVRPIWIGDEGYNAALHSIETSGVESKNIKRIIAVVSRYTTMDILKELLTSKCWIGVK